MNPNEGDDVSKLIRTDEVMERTGLSRTTLWRKQRDGEFPSRVKLGPNSVAWRESDVEEWIDNLPPAEPNGWGDGD